MPDLYFDPAGGGPRSNLIEELVRALPESGLKPFERQVTVTLAWLLDRSDVFARAFAKLFLGEGAVAKAERIGARAWATLPPVGVLTKHLYPDLLVVGSDRAFQLLVEVKVDAGIHFVDVKQTMRQPEGYLYAWRGGESPPRGAEHRRVGTLTKGGPGYSPPEDPMRAADVRWQAVRDLLDGLLLEPEVTAVAADFGAVLDDRVLKAPKAYDVADEVIARGAQLLQNVPEQLGSGIPGIQWRPMAPPSEDYVGRHFRVPRPADEPVPLWLHVASEGGKYNEAGAEARVWLGEHDRLPDEVRLRLAEAGFRLVKDASGGSGFRTSIAVDSVRSSGAVVDHAAHVAEWALERLREAGLASVASA